MNYRMLMCRKEETDMWPAALYVSLLTVDALKKTECTIKFWLAFLCPSAHGLNTDTYWHGLCELPTLTASYDSILTEMEPHK